MTEVVKAPKVKEDINVMGCPLKLRAVELMLRDPMSNQGSEAILGSLCGNFRLENRSRSRLKLQKIFIQITIFHCLNSSGCLGIQCQIKGQKPFLAPVRYFYIGK